MSFRMMQYFGYILKSETNRCKIRLGKFSLILTSQIDRGNDEISAMSRVIHFSQKHYVTLENITITVILSISSHIV